MFQRFTVENSTYLLLQELFKIPILLDSFALAGGTSLALQLGTRKSIDLDFFSPHPINTEVIASILEDIYDINYEYINSSKRMLFCNIKGIKCDFVHEPATLLHEFELKDGIKVFSIEDIAAMKLHTICGRGKKKDFFDIYTLLTKYEWATLEQFFIDKYDDTQLYFLYRSIRYFNDAEEDPDIISFEPFTNDWTVIKKYIINKLDS
jgi:predicted nucleotidyltransferase component of viral defense system